jgi:molybdopterin/thiamine biosynthesis adenylyltransferase
MSGQIHPGYTGSTKRLFEEVKALREHHPELRMHLPDVGTPTFELVVKVAHADHHLRLTLPRGYPRIPPEVREIQGPGGAIVPPHPGTRRLLDGQLCLFTHGSDPDAWTAERRAIAAVQKATEFLALERESRIDGGWSGYSGRTLFLRRPAVDILRLPGSFGMLMVASRSERATESFVVHVTAQEPRMDFPAQIDPRWIEVLKHHAQIPWLCLPADAPPWNELVASPTALRERLAQLTSGARLEHVRSANQWLLARESADPLEAVLAHVAPHDVTTVRLSTVQEGDPESVLFQRVDGVTSARGGLASVPVVLVGVGSLGSSVAVALARAGVHDFLLIDADVLSLDNVCRHVGTVHDLGQPKVAVVKQAILAVNPAAAVEVETKPLAWDNPDHGAGLGFERWLDANPRALVISTCASAPVERQLNEVLVERRVPAIHASVLGAAEHGRVFRVIPGQTACYECVLTAQQAAPGRHPRFVADGVDQEHRVPYLQPSLPGLGIDVTQVAMITARLALQTIARVHELGVGFADEVGDHLLWTNRGGWVFDRPLHACVERIARDEACVVCGSGRDHRDEEDGTQVEELCELLGLLRR